MSYPSPVSLPSPSRDNLRSNPHPYAIKTTSTGVLSRSNSTHSSASTSHHFVPSSPTRHKSNHSRPNSHRYSSSLSSNELPRPLPVPPSPFPTKPGFDLPRARADALSQPNLFGQLAVGTDDLPDDPRTWSPSDLSTYLSSSLRLTSPDLPPLAAQDIAAFILTEKISGKIFLRLTDGDLDHYGLTQRWLNALLQASRALRRNSIRGRIWTTSFPSREDDAYPDNYSSTSSSSSLNDMRRARAESGSGHVKGMIASFERSSSPTKSSSSLRSISPVKNSAVNLSDDTRQPPSRPRPQSDILPAYHHTATAMDSEQKKEPRLLPYPPSPASTHQNNGYASFGPPPLLPQDTSSSTTSAFTAFPSGVLPFSPQSTGTGSLILQTPPPDFQAQPQSFSDVFYADPALNSNTTRPLPFPPHSGQYYPPASYASGDGGVYDKGDKDGENGLHGMAMPLPRGMMVPEPDDESSVPVSEVPHVRVYQEREHAVELGDLTLQPPPRLMEVGSSQPLSMISSLENEIVSPRPLHGLGRESATRDLEEKLEELLEPRPRSRIVSHSRVVSTGGGSNSSRPRSRVASINGSWGRKNGNGNGNGNGTPGISKRGSDASMRSGLVVGNDDDGVDDAIQQQIPLRTRVISISSRSHSHRLSGVEVWGETHPHYHRHHLKKRLGIPFGEGDEEITGVGDERRDDVFGGGGGGGGGGGVGKDRDESSSENGEIGNIESVLEKSESLVGGAGVAGAATGVVGVSGEDNVAVTKEPKSSVITVVEGIPLSKLRNVDLKEEEEEEESMELLLERSKRLNGAEAWEMVGEVDTVKRMGEERRGCVGDVFLGKEDGVGGGSDGSRQSLGAKEIASSGFPTPMNKLEGEVEMEPAMGNAGGEEVERELERRVRETREMVEDVRGRLENVEMWIEKYEKRVEKEKKKQRVESSNGMVMRVLRGFSTWFGFYRSSSSTNNNNTTTTTMTTQTGGRRRGVGLGLGLGVSSCVVLFGIGVCMVLLRVLGRRPVGFGIGRMVGHWVVLNGGRR